MLDHDPDFDPYAGLSEAGPDKRILRIIVGGLIIIGIGCFAWAAWGHDHKGMVFNPWCCNGNSETGDCQEIPFTAVTPVDGGYQVTLAPGQHPKIIKKTHTYFIAQDKVRDSTNGLFYGCVYPDEDTLRCFYAPPPGV